MEICPQICQELETKFKKSSQAFFELAFKGDGVEGGGYIRSNERFCYYLVPSVFGASGILVHGNPFSWDAKDHRTMFV